MLSSSADNRAKAALASLKCRYRSAAFRTSATSAERTWTIRLRPSSLMER